MQYETLENPITHLKRRFAQRTIRGGKLVELLTADEKKAIVKNAHRNLEQQLLQAQIEFAINKANKNPDLSIFQTKVDNLVAGINEVEVDFASYLS